jgi:hypothetical protein
MSAVDSGPAARLTEPSAATTTTELPKDRWQVLRDCPDRRAVIAVDHELVLVQPLGKPHRQRPDPVRGLVHLCRVFVPVVEGPGKDHLSRRGSMKAEENAPGRLPRCQETRFELLFLIRRKNRLETAPHAGRCEQRHSEKWKQTVQYMFHLVTPMD